MELKMMKDRVLVELDKPEECTKSGLIVTTSKKDSQHTNTGKVVSVGELSEGYEDIKVGSRVYFDKFSGYTLKVEEIDYLALKSENIIAVSHE